MLQACEKLQARFGTIVRIIHTVDFDENGPREWYHICVPNLDDTGDGATLETAVADLLSKA